MAAEKTGVYILGGVAGLFAGYWAYLYLQDTSSPPGIGEVFDNIKSYFTRAQLVVTGEVAAATGVSVTGGSSYLDIAAGFIAKQEGFSARVYNDQGHQAIGYGHDIVAGDPYDSSSVISESDAYQLLLDDLNSRDSCMQNNVQVALSDNAKAALISFIYNEGCGAFQNSTLLVKINQGDMQGAAAEFSRWVYATDPSTGQKVVLPVLQTRRTDEMNLFLS